MTSEPWTVRYARAQLAIGRPVPSWLHMCVQMQDNGYGCAPCAHPYNQKAEGS